MRFDWRAMFGPALTAATALLAILAGYYFADHPFKITLHPAPLFVCIVTFAGSLNGLASAAISAAIALGCTALLSFNRHAGYDAADLIDLSMLSIAVGAAAAITGLLRQRWVEAFARERVHHATRRTPVGRARSGRYRHRAARRRDPRGVHQPRLSPIFLAA